jgi:hypothetical protein
MKQPPSIVGDLINFRGFVYAPCNPQGVFLLFGTLVRDLRLQVEEVWPQIPYCIARRFTARGWERIALRFTHKSSEAREHALTPQSGELLLCWDHDWPDCPVEVMELQTVIRRLIYAPAFEPVPTTPFHQEFERYLMMQSSRTQYLFRALDRRIRALSDAIEPKPTLGRNNAGGVSYYAPERLFLCVDFRKTGHGLALSVFTRGHPPEGVKTSASSLWGSVAVRNEADLSKAILIAKASYEAMQLALQRREPTSKSAVRKGQVARISHTNEHQ